MAELESPLGQPTWGNGSELHMPKPFGKGQGGVVSEARRRGHALSRRDTQPGTQMCGRRSKNTGAGYATSDLDGWDDNFLCYHSHCWFSSISKSAFLYHEGRLGAPSDYPRAFELYTRGCDLTSSAACSSAGLMCENGEGIAVDFTRAFSYYQRSCDLGRPRGCAFQGEMTLKGKGTAVNREAGLELLRRGCKGGDDWGCDQLKKAGAAP